MLRKNSCTRMALEGGPVSVNPEGNQQAAVVYLGEKRHLFDTVPQGEAALFSKD